MKTPSLWQSEDRQLQQLTKQPRYHSLFEKYIDQNYGNPVIIILKNGQQIPAILIGGSKSVVAVRRFAKAERLIVPIREIQAIATGAHA